MQSIVDMKGFARACAMQEQLLYQSLHNMCLCFPRLRRRCHFGKPHLCTFL